MGDFLKDFGMQAGQQAVGGILGMILGGVNDARQIRQQRKLTQMEMAANKELMAYNNALQYDLWQKTNYSEQVAQLKKAGLNPALLYGMGGAGGSTTGSPGGSVSGAGHAPVGGGEVMGLMNMGLQNALLKAQKELIEAETRNKDADTENKQGVERDLAKTQIQTLLQDIKVKEAQEILIKADTALRQFELAFEKDARKSRLEAIDWEAAKRLEEVEELFRKNVITKATQNAMIDTIIKQSAQVGLMNILISEQAKTERTKQALNQAEVEAIAKRIMQGWADLDIKGFTADTGRMQVMINEELKEMEISLNASEKIRNWFETITDLLPWKSRKPVGFQRNSQRSY